MNENFYNQRKIRSMNVAVDLNKNGHLNNGVQMPQNYLHNTMHGRQPLSQTQSANHIPQNMIPQLMNLISPQISVSQSGNQPMINMGFNATPFLQNQLYSLQNNFGTMNPMTSQGYGTGNISYMNNMRLNNGPPVQSAINYKEPKMGPMVLDPRKSRNEGSTNNKVINYPIRLLVNSELVGPLIGRKGEKIKEITASTGAKIDIKRESVPYSQFGLNNYMFSGCNRKGSGSGDNEHVVAANNHTNRGESQIVFIVGEPEKCTAAIQEIMKLCTQEAAEQGREEPNLGLLAEDRFCARIIGKEGRYLNFVRCKSSSQVHVSNVPTITTLSQQPHIISLDRIISCRGGGLSSLLEAERLISEKVRQCVTEDGQNNGIITQKPLTRLSKDDSFLPPRAAEMTLFNQYCAPQAPPAPSLPIPLPSLPSMPSHLDDVFLSRRPGIIGSGIVHKANPHWPDNLKLDENLYVRIAQMCAGSIIGSEGKSVKRIMADTGTYVQISKANLSPVESVPAVHTYRKMAIPNSSFSRDDLNQRLVTIKGSVPNQCSALAHIYNRVKICYNQSNDGVIPHDFQDVRLWVMVRIPKIMLGRLIGKDGKVIRQLQINSHTFLSFPRLRPSSDKTEELTELSLATEEPLDTDPKKEATVVPRNDVLHNPDSAIFGDSDLHPIEIFGSYDAVESAIFMIRRLIYSCIFTQYGPALIPGPMTPAPLNVGPLQSTFVMSPMLQWHRRNGDLSNQYYSTIPTMPRVFGPGISLPTHINTKNFRRPPFIQRLKGEQRSQTDNKGVSTVECGGGGVNNEGVDGEDGIEDGGGNDEEEEKDESYMCNNEEAQFSVEASSIDNGNLIAMSPTKNVLIMTRPDVTSSIIFGHDGNTSAGYCQPGTLCDETNQRFLLTSPSDTGTYYTDCSPGNSHFNISSMTEDLSFITAHDHSLSDSSSSFIVDPCAVLPSQSQSANSSFSHWSASANPPF